MKAWERIPVRLRLSLAHAIWMGLLFFAIGVGLYRLVEDNFLESIDNALLGSAKGMREARFSFPRKQLNPIFNSLLHRRLTAPPLIEDLLGQRIIKPYAQIIDLSGKISERSEGNISLPVTTEAISYATKGMETFETFSVDGMLFREVILPIIEHGKFTGELIVVATALDDTIKSLKGLKWILWTALPAGLLASILFGYLLTAKSLKPVRDLSQAAAKLGVDQLGTKLPVPLAYDELYELANTFNGMLIRLEDAFKRLRLFSSNVSHELRTPIAVLRAEAELALRKKRTPEEYEAALHNIVKETNSMTYIVEDLLLFSKAQSGKIEVSWEDISFDTFFNEILDSLKLQIEEKSITVNRKNLGITCLCGSATYLHIAFRNILQNAIKHSPSHASIEIEAYNKDGSSQINIIDHGEGIPKENLPYIFDPFYRVDSDRNRKNGGTGIGLSLTDALIKLHGGTIYVASAMGSHTVFSVTLPTCPSPSRHY